MALHIGSPEDLAKQYSVYVQFVQTHGGVEGDSASIAVATSIISALKQLPVRQDTAMTGSLSVRGEVLPIGGVTYKIEAAIEAGLKQVIIPKANLQDVMLDNGMAKKIKIIAVENISEVIEVIFDSKKNQKELKRIIKLIQNK